MEDVAAPADDDPRRGRIARLTSRSAGHSVLYSVASSVGTLALQLLTGVLTARVLGSTGRGEIEAVMSWVNLAAIVFAVGLPTGFAFFQARAAGPSGSLLAGGLMSVAVLGLVAVAVTELLIPWGFAEQRSDLLVLARLAMPGILVVMGVNLVRALLGANNFFRSVALNTVGQPFVYAVCAVTLWALGRYSVGAIVAVQIASFVVVFVAGVRVLRSVTDRVPARREEIRSAAGYGIRGYGATLSRVANVRLDVVLLPAFVTADEIGVYVVAVSVGSMMIALFQQLNRVMFTNTARRGGPARVEFIERIVRAVFFGATSMAVVLAVIGPTLITVVYGEDFGPSGVPLRILLPGLVCWACSVVMGGALAGVGRPGRTSVAQFIGLLITVVGLVVALPRYGIQGAAVVSTLAYSVVALSNLLFLRGTVDLSLRRIASIVRLSGDARRFARLRHRR